MVLPLILQPMKITVDPEMDPMVSVVEEMVGGGRGDGGCGVVRVVVVGL